MNYERCMGKNIVKPSSKRSAHKEKKVYLPDRKVRQKQAIRDA